MLNFWRRSPGIHPLHPEKLGTRDWPSQNWNRRSLWVAAPKSLVHVEYEKLLENYLGAQGTFNRRVGGGSGDDGACLHRVNPR